MSLHEGRPDVPMTSVKIEGRVKGLPVATVHVYHEDSDYAAHEALRVYELTTDAIAERFKGGVDD